MSDCAVVFDMDGVLVDSYEAHFASWRRTARAHRLEMARQQFAATFGRTTREIIRHLWPNVPPAGIPAWDDEKEAAYREIIALNFPEMDGAHELLESLHAAGFALAVGSSGPPENVAAVVRRLRAGRLLAATVSGMDVTHGKPHPEVFLKAAEKLNVAPANCAVVEDAPAGVLAARNAGMAAIALTGTAGYDQLAEQAHLVVDSHRELDPDKIGRVIRRNHGL